MQQKTPTPNSKEFKKLVMMREISINYRHENKETMLLIALKKADHLLASWIVSRPEADINITDQDGNTALMIACLKNSASIIIEILARPDLDINKRNKKGNTAFDFFKITEHSSRKILKMFLQKKALTTKAVPCNIIHPVIKTLVQEERFTAIDHAVQIGLITNQTITNATNTRHQNNYIPHGINVTDSNGDTALIRAARNHRTKLTKILLETNGIDTNHTNKSNCTAFDLFPFTEDEDAEVLEIFLKSVTKLYDKSKKIPQSIVDSALKKLGKDKNYYALSYALRIGMRPNTENASEEYNLTNSSEFVQSYKQKDLPQENQQRAKHLLNQPYSLF